MVFLPCRGTNWVPSRTADPTDSKVEKPEVFSGVLGSLDLGSSLRCTIPASLYDPGFLKNFYSIILVGLLRGRFFSRPSQQKYSVRLTDHRPFSTTEWVASRSQAWWHTLCNTHRVAMDTGLMCSSGHTINSRSFKKQNKTNFKTFFIWITVGFLKNTFNSLELKSWREAIPDHSKLWFKPNQSKWSSKYIESEFKMTANTGEHVYFTVT